MQTSLTMRSSNRKVGPIPVSTTEKASCPASCRLKDTDCYARFGPLGIHWSKLSQKQRGMSFSDFCDKIAEFAPGTLWRHNQAGDLPQRKDGKIDEIRTIQLASAAKHTRGWTYTHYSINDPHNLAVIQTVNKIGGLLINISTETLGEADRAAALNLPTTILLPLNTTGRKLQTPNGIPIVICPAQTQDSVSCASCQLCSKQRKSIVGFISHGTAKKRLSNKLGVL